MEELAPSIKSCHIFFFSKCLPNPVKKTEKEKLFPFLKRKHAGELLHTKQVSILNLII